MARYHLRILAPLALLAAGLPAQTPRQLGDLVPGPAGSFPTGWQAVGATTVLLATDPTLGLRVPWRTDGTPAGTWSLGSTGVGSVVPFGDRFLLVGPASVPATDLMTTDGRAPGLTLLRKFHDVAIADAAVLGELAVFAADDGLTGHEVWVTDGTPAGTRLLADLIPGAASSGPTGFARSGRTAYFFAMDPNGSNVLWQTDGRNVSVASRAFSQPPWLMLVSGTRAFYVLRLPLDVQVLEVLDLATGVVTPLATTMTLPGTPSQELSAYGDSVVFDWYTAAYGSEPWISDGTAAGTHRIADLEAGPAGSAPRVLGIGPGDQVLLATTSGELYATDGTAAGTRLLWGAGTFLAWYIPGSDDRGFVVTNQAVARRWDVLETDGTPGGTRLLLRDTPAAFLRSGELFYPWDDGVTGLEPWAVPVWPVAVEVGEGCGTDPRPPTLHATTPRLGSQLRLRGTHAPIVTAAAIVIGFVADPPVRIAGGGGCVSELDLGSAAVLQWFAPATSDWSWPVPLPSVPALQGLTVAMQVWFGPSGNPGGLESTNGVHLTLGL